MNVYSVYIYKYTHTYTYGGQPRILRVYVWRATAHFMRATAHVALPRLAAAYGFTSDLNKVILTRAKTDSVG